MTAYAVIKRGRCFVPVHSFTRRSFNTVQYTAPGTYTFVVPAGVNRIEVVVQGAGGSGGATWEYHGDWGAAAGGGAGAYVRGYIDGALEGQSFGVTVGKGGAAVGGVTPGNSGGASTFGTFITCGGGGGGAAGRGGSYASGGGGGTATVSPDAVGLTVVEKTNGAGGTGNAVRNLTTPRPGGIGRKGTYGSGGQGVPSGWTSGAGQDGFVGIYMVGTTGEEGGYCTEVWKLHTPAKGTI